jgi:hypothetical protein
VSAADKWIAPFFRRTPGVLTQGDAAAACLLGPAGGPAVAELHDIRTSISPGGTDPWTADADALREHLVAHAARVIGLARDPQGPPPLLAGDGYDAELLHELARRTGLALLEPPQPQGIHLGSAAPLFALGRAVSAAVQAGRALDVIVWTVSTAGFAGALRLRCRPDARCHGGVWLPASTRAPGAPPHPELP